MGSIRKSGIAVVALLLVWVSVTAATASATALAQASSASPNSPCAISLKTPKAVAKDRLDGRLGGSRVSWDGRYGEGNPAATDDTTLQYTWKGCGPGSGAHFVNDQAVWISLWSHKPETIANGKATEPHDANWTQDEALAIARKLAPSDAVLSEPSVTDSGNVVLQGQSTLLGEDVGWDTYGATGVSSTPGEFEILLTLDSTGEVYEIDVALRGFTIG